MRWLGPTFLGVMFVLAACQPGGPPEEEAANGTVRNVVAQLATPQALKVDIKLPVVIKPVDEYELRSSAGGTIIALPFDEGDVVPGSSIPPGRWLEVKDFKEALPEDSEITPAMVDMRNLTHLADVGCFARIDDRQLVQSFREAQQNYDQAVRDLKRTEDYPQSTGAQLDQARTRRDMARIAANRALAMLEDTYICNPEQGVLTELMRKKGEYVNPGELIGKVAVMDRLVAELEVPEAHRQVLSKGDELEIRIGSLEDADGNPEKRLGTITRIDHVAHPETHSFTVEIEIANDDLSLPAGVFGTTRIVIYQRPDALVVPLSAINLNGEEKSIFVVNDDNTVTEVKKLNIGRMTYQWAELRNRDLLGKRIVTFGAQNLSDGDQVDWTDEDPYVVNDKGGETTP